MKDILIAFVFVLNFLNVSGQNTEFKAPDYNGIKSIMNDIESEYYYPKLMERYVNSDTTLSFQDFRVLYYGFLFTDAYSPYGQSDYLDSINFIANKDTLLEDDYRSIIKYERLVLKEYPFNLRDLNALAYSYFQIGDTLSMLFTDFKINMIINTILYTGDGKKEKTAWHVISVSHEYDILGLLGFQFGGSQSLTNKGCDYLEVQENEYDIKGFYFDVNKILDKEAEIFKN